MPQGQLNTYADSSITPKRTLSDVIKIIDPSDIPCQTKFGLNMHSRIRMVNFPNHKYEWMEGTLRAQTDILNGAINNAVTSLVATDGSKFRPGDVIQIGSEYLWISAVATNTLTVSRGYGGTTAASQSNGATITYLFPARLEGDSSHAQPYNLPTAPFNYSQIFQAELRVSESEVNASSRYGMDDLMDFRRMQLMGGYGGGEGKAGNAGELLLDLEKTIFNGVKVLRTSSLGGAMGGLDTFITTNLSAMAGASLDPLTIENQIANCWQAGGKPKTIICNQWARRKITSFYAGNVRTERREDVGGIVITTIHTQFGDLDLLMTRWCPSNKLYIVQDDLIGWATLRDWSEKELAQDGDYFRREIKGEFGFIVCNEKAHAIVSGFSTTS